MGFGSSTSLPGKIKSPDVILAIPNGGLKYFSGTVYRGGLKNFLKFFTAMFQKLQPYWTSRDDMNQNADVNAQLNILDFRRRRKSTSYTRTCQDS